MTPINIFLSPVAYYVRLDVSDLEEQKKQSEVKKWFDNRKGMLTYEFIEFERLDDDFETTLPLTTTKIGVIGSRFLCYNPFEYGNIVGAFTLHPDSADFDIDHGLTLNFTDNYTKSIDRYSKYYTGGTNKWIQKINFRMDESYSTLREKVIFSDKSHESNKYHLISRVPVLSKPDFYTLFDLK